MKVTSTWQLLGQPRSPTVVFDVPENAPAPDVSEVAPLVEESPPPALIASDEPPAKAKKAKKKERVDEH